MTALTRLLVPLSLVIVGVLAAGAALAAAPLPAAPPGDALEVVGRIITIVMQVGLMILPVIWAFIQHDKDALAKLMAALPDIYDVVAKERRKAEERGAVVAASTSPLERAMQIARTIAGGTLRAADEVRVKAALEAHHERLTEAGLRVTPVRVPTLAPPPLPKT